MAFNIWDADPKSQPFEALRLTVQIVRKRWHLEEELGVTLNDSNSEPHSSPKQSVPEPAGSQEQQNATEDPSNPDAAQERDRKKKKRRRSSTPRKCSAKKRGKRRKHSSSSDEGSGDNSFSDLGLVLLLLLGIGIGLVHGQRLGHHVGERLGGKEGQHRAVEPSAGLGTHLEAGP
ncbi:unnamed protein product [Tilletia laevis]|uniref:Uncharacterized protein n=2 Tax=Tilletia TaxID=13289 RepID=A0A177U6T5_9BASI|nr:hypothetical protein CF336_g4319 [Tilletia laevis]KAE8195780.1 hypothetical protein CF328_g4327 [Tilletia controversa]KAE8256891.1 hypothetical protein A4X03_0g4951 [Tilletia caries]KAE8200858.1 hypothetical protein CF335_g3860 [Tilletia laevis]CAD6924783.1 unnamed protein product [Tilletia caries]